MNGAVKTDSAFGHNRSVATLISAARRTTISPRRCWCAGLQRAQHAAPLRIRGDVVVLRL